MDPAPARCIVIKQTPFSFYIIYKSDVVIGCIVYCSSYTMMEVSSDEKKFTDIAAIKFWEDDTWGPIRGRVISRSSALRTVNDPMEPSTANYKFTFTLRDLTGEIEIEMFSDLAEEMYQEFQLNNCYEIENYTVTKADHKYTLTKHECCLRLSDDTRISFPPDRDFTDKIPRQKFKRTLIGNIKKLYEKKNVLVTNVLGVCTEVQELVDREEMNSGRPLKKRVIIVADESQTRIEVQLWDHEAINFNVDLKQRPIIYLNGALINIYKDCFELNTRRNSMLLVGFFTRPIRGRVISRTGFKTYDKPGEPGVAEQMSTLILRDRTGEIKIVLFAEIARQLFASESKYMSKIPCNEFSRTLISDVANLKDYDRVNVLGICVSVGEASQVSVRGTDRQALVREVWLADESNKRISVTLWDYEAANFEMTRQFPIYFHNLRVKYYERRLELKSDLESMGVVNPAGVPEERVRELIAWRDAGGADQPLQTLQAM
ncbi:hypothetical protein B566_EDAN005089 [Ephemera danica]|nr:hypothetical protein B566_EDAN005089 [Ephemera danica]